MKEHRPFSTTFAEYLLHIEIREGPDAHSDIEELCPDHGAHAFRTQCGVTRCQFCGKVAG
jgi:hypothetical protein